MTRRQPFPLTAPCAGCPMSDRAGAVLLPRARRSQLAALLLDDDGRTFYCHKTTAYDDAAPSGDPCAGAEVLRWRSGRPSVVARMAAVMGLRRPDDYDTAHVPWPDLDAWASEALNLGGTP